LSNSWLLGLKITTLSSILTSKVDQIVKRIGFTALLASSTFHYWLEQDISRTYYLFFYGFSGMFLGGLLLLRWSNVESGAQLANRLNKGNNAEKEDQDSLKYGSMVMLSSVSLVFVSFVISVF